MLPAGRVASRRPLSASRTEYSSIPGSSMRPLQVVANVRTKSLGSVTAALLVGLAFSDGAASIGGKADDPAVAQVRTLTSSLLKSMRAGRSESMGERYRKLEPVIERTFAMPLMTRLSVGPNWAQFPQPQQQALVAAFSRYTIASYAHNFRSYDGQRFAIGDEVVHRGPEEVVRASIVRTNDSPANLLYLTVVVNGSWRIVDVYYNGISQLALHRADFASAIGSGGAPVLIAHLNKVSADLMR